MVNPILEIRCPCCKNTLEVDTTTRKVRVLRRDTGGLDDLVEEHRNEAARLAGMFESAQDATRRDAERLDELFEKAKDDASTDDTPVRRPFDLD